MWFIFGILTLTCFSIYAGYKRINATWKGKTGHTNGISYQYKTLKNKNRVTGLLISIDGPPEYDYIFKKESSLDHFFKSVGLSSEHQVGNKKFDELAYIVSDNPRFHNVISSSHSIVDAVVKILGGEKRYTYDVKEIRHNYGRLWVKIKVFTDVKEKDISIISHEIVPLLKIIKDELTSVTITRPEKWKDPFVIKAAIILAISTGLALNGLTHMVRLMWGYVPFTIDTVRLLTDSLFYGLGITLTLILVSVFVLGRSARMHLVLIELIIIGSFGAVSTSFAELHDLNIELDKSTGIEYTVKTLDKKIKKSRRSTSYYLYVDDWTKEKTRRKVNVSSNFYKKIAIGNRLILTQKHGYLNYRWIEKMDKKIPSGDTGGNLQ